MAEEQAWLVRARSDSEGSAKLGGFGSVSRTMAYTEDRLTVTEAGEGAATSPPDHTDAESGDLLDYNDASVLEQFHEDALRQAGCGMSQARVALSTGLAVAGASLELAGVPFVLPSAEIEFCILPHEKNWLVLISLVGGSLGAAGWGPLGERLGRRRALLSCLAVNAVFAAIAAVMPTYGTFMMARFCSAIGSGGIVSTSYTYLGECVSRGQRTRVLPVLVGACGAGGLLAAVLATAVLPHNGAATLLEDREHFSAWHRYLLLCTLPILASLISLIWSQESPRYLLDAGREVDAMVVYQNIHSGNQISVCGSRTQASAEGLRELALPGKRRPANGGHVRHSLKVFWQAFTQLFSHTYRKTTLSLGGVLLFTMAIQFYLSSYTSSVVEELERVHLEQSRVTQSNMTHDNRHYNETMENIVFVNVTFTNCTFRDMLMSHVQFRNCSFGDVAFENIKTSYTNFLGCYFFNSTIIDTDMQVGRELDGACVLSGSIVRGVGGGCGRRAELAWGLGPRARARAAAAGAGLGAAAVAVLLRPPLFVLSLACLLMSPLLYVVDGEIGVYVVEALYQLVVMLVFYVVNAKIVDSYQANLRCTAGGLILSVAYMGGALVKGAGAGGPALSAVVTAMLAGAAVMVARFGNK